MQGVIISSRTFKPGDDKYNFYSGNGYLEYLEDLEKHWNEKNDGEIPPKMLELIKQAKNQANFLDYERREKDFDGKSGESHLPLFFFYFNVYYAGTQQRTAAENSNIYSMVISLPEEISKLNKDTLDYNKAKVLARIAFDEIMKANAKWGFDSKYFNYDAVLHLGTKKSHLHIRLYQPKGTPESKIVERCCLSQWGFNQAKFAIAQEIEGLKQDSDLRDKIFKSKVKLQDSFKKTITLDFINNLSGKKEIRNEGQKYLDQKFNQLVDLQKQCYKLFKAQPVQYHYINHKNGKEVFKDGLDLKYANLSVPVYKLEDIKQAKKTLSENYTKEDLIEKLEEIGAKREIQPIQVIYKKQIDEFRSECIKIDQILNKNNQEFYGFCEDWKNNTLSKVGGSSKTNQRNDRMEEVLASQLNKKVFRDFEKNTGNHIIKCITNYSLKHSKSPTATKLLRKNCSGKIINDFNNCYYQYKKLPAMAMNLENLYSNYIDIEIRKLKQQQKLEEIARNRNVTVEEIKEEFGIN